MVRKEIYYSLINLFFLCFFLTSNALSAEESVPPIFQECQSIKRFEASTVLVEGLPQTYIHCPIPQQIAMYRKIYNAMMAYNKELYGKNVFDEPEYTNPVDLSSKQISRKDIIGAGSLNSEEALLDILNNAFALVTYSITDNTTLMASEEQKKHYLSILKKVYDLKEKIFLERRKVREKYTSARTRTPYFTINEFQHFNLILAHIMESFNSLKEVDYTIIFRHLRLMYEVPSQDNSVYVPMLSKAVEWFDADLSVWQHVLIDRIRSLLTAIESGRAADDFYTQLNQENKSKYLILVEALQTEIDQAFKMLSTDNGDEENKRRSYTHALGIIIHYYKKYDTLYSLYKLNLLPPENGDYSHLLGEQLESDTHLNNVLFIIYGIPNSNVTMRGIHPRHFIEQNINPDYSGFIAYFDPISKCPKCGGIFDQLRLPTGERSQKEANQPHYGSTEGTYQMLLHDLQHCNFQQDEWTECKQSRKIIREKLDEMYQQGKKMDPNAMKALGVVLFSAIHEIPVFCRAYADNNADYIKNIAQRMKETLKFDEGQLDSRVRRYKEDNSDWAVSLSGITDNAGKPFFREDGAPFDLASNSFLEEDIDNGKYTETYQKAIVNSFERFWDYAQTLFIQN